MNRTTFAVSDVKLPSDTLPTTSLEAFLASTYPKIVACSAPQSAIITDLALNHVLLNAAHCAFAEHRPLVLTPDAIWLTIAQGFAQHINLHAEDYRTLFVEHEGKKRLEYVTAAEPGSPAFPWDTVISIFTEKVREQIGTDTVDLITSDFSTTGPTERTVSQVLLLDAMKSYFEYYGATMCGIPSITLEGATADWEQLAAKVARLAKYGGLDWWIDRVKPIIAQFIAASRGEVDVDFWQSLYKMDNESGGPHATGWILRLIPYIKGEDDAVDRQNPLVLYADNGYDWGAITFSSTPRSVSQVPFIWNWYGTEVKYEFLAGLVGVVQGEDLSLKPVAGWAIRQMDETEDNENG